MKLRKFFAASPGHDVMNAMTMGTIISLVIKGAIVGAIAGFFAATFRYLIQWGEEFRKAYMAHTDPVSVAMWLGLMVILGYACYRLLKWAPLSGGSGIPQIEGEMMGIFDMQPYRTFISKYFGGVFNGLCGFSVGREGPSVQLGGAIGKIVSYFFRSSLREQRILTSAGAAAGLTAAFSAPVSGAIFVFEEVHKKLLPRAGHPHLYSGVDVEFCDQLPLWTAAVLGVHGVGWHAHYLFFVFALSWCCYRLLRGYLQPLHFAFQGPLWSCEA